MVELNVVGWNNKAVYHVFMSVCCTRRHSAACTVMPTGKKLVAPLDTIVLLNDVSCNAIRKLSERLLGDTFKCFINLTFLSCCDLSCWYYMVKMMPFVLFDSHSARLVRWYYSLWHWFQPFCLLSRNFNWANRNVSSKTPLSVRYRGETSVLIVIFSESWFDVIIQNLFTCVFRLKPPRWMLQL